MGIRNTNLESIHRLLGDYKHGFITEEFLGEAFLVYAPIMAKEIELLRSTIRVISSKNETEKDNFRNLMLNANTQERGNDS